MIRENTVIGLTALTLVSVLACAFALGVRVQRLGNYLEQAITVGDHREWQRATVAQSPAWTPADMDDIHDRRHGRLETFR